MSSDTDWSGASTYQRRAFVFTHGAMLFCLLHFLIRKPKARGVNSSLADASTKYQRELIIGWVSIEGIANVEIEAMAI